MMFALDAFTVWFNERLHRLPYTCSGLIIWCRYIMLLSSKNTLFNRLGAPRILFFRIFTFQFIHVFMQFLVKNKHMKQSTSLNKSPFGNFVQVNIAAINFNLLWKHLWFTGDLLFESFRMKTKQFFSQRFVVITSWNPQLVSRNAEY